MTKTEARPRVIIAFGTRPEAIKMAPVIEALRAQGEFDVRIAVTAQHRELLDQVLRFFSIVPDIDLDLMEAGQSLDVLAARILRGFGEVLDRELPDRVIVHGDTLTTMMTSLACYLRRIPVAHVEAGLRTGNIYAPWPEEAARRITGTLADLHFAPTEGAVAALLAENVPSDTIHHVGNTVIDALLSARDRIAADPSLAPVTADIAARFAGKRIIAVTAHRRESLGPGMARISKALRHLATREDIAIVFPMHPNPGIGQTMRPALHDAANIALIKPLDYPDFVALLTACDIVLTDSGGIQEEAPSLGKPVLVMRETTERPEGIAAGTALLVGTDTQRIIAQAERLLDDRDAHKSMARRANPYGDGQASVRIGAVLARSHAVV